MAHQESFVKALTEILVEQGSLAKKELVAIVREFKNSEKERFDQFLLDEGLVDEDDLLRALSTYYKVPSFEVAGHLFDHRLLHMFPKDVMLRNAFIPLEVDEDESFMTVVASDPDEDVLLPIIGQYVSYDIHFLVGHHLEITDAVKEFYDKSLTQVRKSIFSEDDEDGYDLDDEQDVIIYDDSGEEVEPEDENE